MIQATLIFLLGFLAAGFIAVLAGPAIWRRAVALTRRRMEAALPLSLTEIRADKDAVRAEYAVATRRLEMTIRSLREEMVAQTLETERVRARFRQASQTLDEKEAARAGLEGREQELLARLDQTTQEAGRLAERLAGRERLLAERTAELESLGDMYDEASFAASSRQIDLVAQEANVERMSEEISALTAARRQADAQLQEAGRRIREQERAVREEKRKNTVLERKAAKLTASLSDAEEKLQRREGELQRLRGKARGSGSGDADTALLRERIKDLAAQVVSLTAQVEGPDSEIYKLLGAEAGTGPKGAAGGPGLAERIRALQKRTPEGSAG